MKRLLVLIFTMVVSFVAFSQPPTPSQIGTGVMGTDAAIVAMGGTGVALCDNPYAPFWNPAGLALLKGFHMPFSLSARVENIETAKDWNDLVDIFSKDNPTVDDFNTARDIAKKISDKTVLAEINPFFALSGNRFAVSIYGMALGSGQVKYNQRPPEELCEGDVCIHYPGGEVISGDIAGYYLSNLCFSFSGGSNKRLWGVNIRSINGKYSPYEREITLYKGNVVATYNPYKEETSSALGLDYGLLLLGKDGTRYGVLLRNINSPKLFSGANELKLDMDMDVGVAKRYSNGVLAAQWTNALTKGRIDLGCELRWGILALRAGILDGSAVWGIGLGKGNFRLDVASGKTVKEKAALSFSLF
ncbi:MAG: hypothetical protein ACP5QS_01995 [bacterium]